MSVFKKILLLICFPLAFNALAQTELTPQGLKSMRLEMNQAAQNKDFDKYVSYFTPNAKITLDMPKEKGGKVTMRFGKFKRMIKKIWKMDIKATTTLGPIETSIKEDKQSAIVTDTFVETVTINGKKMVNKATEQMKIVLVNEKPLIKIHYVKVAG